MVDHWVGVLMDKVDALGLELVLEQRETTHALGARAEEVHGQLVLDPHVDRAVLGAGQQRLHLGRQAFQELGDLRSLQGGARTNGAVGRVDHDRRRRCQAAGRQAGRPQYRHAAHSHALRRIEHPRRRGAGNPFGYCVSAQARQASSNCA